jgi:hypothetical protein
VAEQPHARLYNGLPPVHPQRWRWLIVGAVVVIAGLGIAVPVFALTYAIHSVPSSWGGGGGRTVGGDVVVFDRDLLIRMGAAFIVGGVLGFALARTWWSTLVIYAVGLVLWYALIPCWFFWIFGVSAGVGVRHLIHRRRVLRASFVSQPG